MRIKHLFFPAILLIFFLLPRQAEAIATYQNGYYTKLCGTEPGDGSLTGINGGYNANGLCSGSCNITAGSCTTNGSQWAYRLACQGKTTNCAVDPQMSGVGPNSTISLGAETGCGQTVQLDVFNKNCYETGSWSCISPPQGFITWYSGDCTCSQAVVDNVSMTVAPNPVLRGNDISFNVGGANGTAEGSTYINDSWSGGVTGDARCDNIGDGFWGSKTCPASELGTYSWTHYWRHCEGSTDLSSCSNQCSKSVNFSVTCPSGSCQTSASSCSSNYCSTSCDATSGWGDTSRCRVMPDPVVSPTTCSPTATYNDINISWTDTGVTDLHISDDSAFFRGSGNIIFKNVTGITSVTNAPQGFQSVWGGIAAFQAGQTYYAMISDTTGSGRYSNKISFSRPACGSWSGWSGGTCSVTACGLIGTLTGETRTCTGPAAGISACTRTDGSLTTSDNKTETRSGVTGCATPSCPINGVWNLTGSDWDTFCSTTCGLGYKTRNCNNPPPINGGLECLLSDGITRGLSETVECNLTPCSSAWIQAVGDVHSNSRINAPGGP